MLLAPAHFEPIFRHFMAIKSNFMAIRHDLKLFQTPLPHRFEVTDLRDFSTFPVAFHPF